jgi:putative PLP-dependent aminotransferase (TIGR04422 family)
MSVNIWPSPNNKLGIIFSASSTSEHVEAQLSEMFAGANPVLCSSARSSLSLIIEHMQLSRDSLVRVPAFASHCLLETVSRFATPAPYQMNTNCDASIVYHQWGISQGNLINNPGTIIEDACDSIYLENKISMKLGGEYEVWSLPKILACSTGGVIWCKNEKDADSLRELRNNRGHSRSLQWYLRMLGEHYPSILPYWSGVESLCGNLPERALNEILFAFKNYDEIKMQRKNRLDLVANFLSIDSTVISDSRLPCCIPLLIEEDSAKFLTELGINIGFRYFEKINSDNKSELTKVYPLPIHQQVPMALLEAGLDKLKEKEAICIT